MMQSGKLFGNLDASMQHGYLAYTSAPVLGNLHIVLNVPALGIVTLITWLVYRGIKETRNASNIMVAIKLAVVVLVILVGSFYITPANWNPFMPNGVGGILKGVSAVFFAYIGFDAISTTAEECKDPQRDLPLDGLDRRAQSIQLGMLPQRFPDPQQSRVELYAKLIPAKIVGGDFYDFIWIDFNLLGLVMADVSGKGIPAALLMAKAMTLIRAHQIGRAHV